MKIRQNKNGSYTVSQIPDDLFHALADLAGDLGNGNAVLYFDPKEYGEWGRPNKATRKTLTAFAKASDPFGDWDWDARFDVLDKPKFARRKP